MFIPVFSIPDPFVKMSPDPGSATLIFWQGHSVVNMTVIKINSADHEVVYLIIKVVRPVDPGSIGQKGTGSRISNFEFFWQGLWLACQHDSDQVSSERLMKFCTWSSRWWGQWSSWTGRWPARRSASQRCRSIVLQICIFHIRVSSFALPRNFGTDPDPDPRIHTSDLCPWLAWNCVPSTWYEVWGARCGVRGTRHVVWGMRYVVRGTWLVMSNQRFFKIVCFRFPTNVPKKNLI